METDKQRTKEPRKGLFIRGGVCGIYTTFLVDTGSSDTVISSEIFNQIPIVSRPLLKKMDMAICQADGGYLTVMGRAEMELEVGSMILRLPIVVADLHNTGILGMDFLLATNSQLDLHELQIQIGEEVVACTTEQAEPFCMVVATKKTIIPSGHEAIIPTQGETPISFIGTGLVENARKMKDDGILVANTLVDTTSNILPVRVLNASSQPVTIYKGSKIGMISRLPEPQPNPTGHTRTLKSRDREVQTLPTHMKELNERSRTLLNDDEAEQLTDLLLEYSDIFAVNDADLGRTGIIKHKINTGSAAPIRQHPRRLPTWQQTEADKQVGEMLEKGINEPSASPWSSPVVLVRKKDGTMRFCIDYRKLNDVTTKDAYPIPRIDDTIQSLAGAKWFSTLDLASGYWQVELDEEAKEKSAFSTRAGLYQWRVMPFGLCNAPSTFERLMESIFAGLQHEIMLLYLDDLIVFAPTIQEELKRLGRVFEQLRSAGLKLKPAKCNLFQKSVVYLGHVVSDQGVATDPEKIRAVREWPTPRTVKEVRSFLGLASYYRRYIKSFADTARPLHRLTEKKRHFTWDASCETAFNELKSKLTSSPILAYPTTDGDFILDTDASDSGIGAVLSQVQDGVERVIGYASRALSKPERNYCVTRRELLAVVHFVKYFRQYLYGQKFTVRSDHGALRWLLNFKDPEGQIARWIQVLGEYDFRIIHRAGRSHGNADGMSRLPCRQCGRVTNQEEPGEPHPEDTKNVAGEIRVIMAQPTWRGEKMETLQQQDPTIGPVLDALRSGRSKPKWQEISALSPATKVYLGEWERLHLRDGTLYRRWESKDGKQVIWQTILPECCRQHAMDELHNAKTAGHLGYKKTLGKMRDRFYWYGMTMDVKDWCRKCECCATRKPPAKRRQAPLQQYRVGAPMERIALDVLGPFPESNRGNRVILVVGDYFTKWVEAYAMPNQEASTCAEKLVAEFISRFGVPRQLHSDQGRNFESTLFAEMCQTLGIEKTRTTPFHPKSDGMVERFNKTLTDMLAKMINPAERQKDWDEYIPFALMAYRSSVHESTGETPNMMMLGREVVLPVDLTTEPQSTDLEEASSYAGQLRGILRETHAQAREILRESGDRQKRNYDRHQFGTPYSEGQFVWYFNATRTKGLSPKLQKKWKGPYLITKKLSDVTYRIQESSRGKPKIVHSDKLKPYTGEEREPWLEPGHHRDTKTSGDEFPTVKSEREQETAPKAGVRVTKKGATTCQGEDVIPDQSDPPLRRTDRRKRGNNRYSLRPEIKPPTHLY